MIDACERFVSSIPGFLAEFFFGMLKTKTGRWLIAGLAIAFLLKAVMPDFTAQAVMLVAMAAGSTFSAVDPNEQPYPAKGCVRLAEWTLAGGIGVAAFFVPAWPSPLVALGAALTVLTARGLIGVLGRRHLSSQPTEAFLGAWVSSIERQPRWVGLVYTSAGALVAGLLAYGGGFRLLPFLVGLSVSLAPAARFRAAAKRDAGTRLEVEYALAGALQGGAWNALQQNAQRIPDKGIELDARGRPRRIVLPLPERLTAEQQAKVEADVADRLDEWGVFNFQWRTGRHRDLTITRIKGFPDFIEYPGSADHPWNEFPFGMLADGSEAVWNILDAPHGLISGVTGGGKSVMQRSILWHALQHEEWKIIGIDLKRVELGYLRKYKGRVLKVASTLEDAVVLLEALKEQTETRYEEMEAAGVNSFLDLPNPPPPVLVMIDEMANLLVLEGVKTEEGKAQDELHGKARFLVAWLARTSRAAGIHLACATQRPDSSILGGGELKMNLDFRCAVGRLDGTPSSMVLDVPDASTLPRIKGRGMFRIGGDLKVFQGYYSDQSWYDNHLAAQAASLDAEPQDAEDDDEEPPVPPVDTCVPPSGGTPAGPASRPVPRAQPPMNPPTTPRKPLLPPRQESPPNQTEQASGYPGQRESARHKGTRIEPFPPGEAMNELERLIGLESTKAEIRRLQVNLKMEKERVALGIGDGSINLSHMVFVGPPGTGKSSVAKCVASLLRDEGVLSGGQCIYVKNREGIVGETIGATAPMTASAVNDALGGVLLIDEAYGLTNRGHQDFGPEAVETLLTAAEDYRGQFVIILCGYPDDMDRMLSSNPGLRSRFEKRIQFPAYSPAELAEIFEVIATADNRVLSPEAKAVLPVLITEQNLGSAEWGNARSIRSLVEQTTDALNRRIDGKSQRTAEDHQVIRPEDLPLSENGSEVVVGEVVDSNADGDAFLAQFVS